MNSSSAFEKRHLLVVDEEGLEHYRKNNTRMAVLPHPRTNEPSMYMFCGDSTILEMQEIVPQNPSSWLVDTYIVSHGKLHICTQIDPLFLLLPVLEKKKDNVIPFDHIFEVEGWPVFRWFGRLSSIKKRLSKICTIREDCENGVMFVQLSANMVKIWLMDKVQRLALTVAETSTGETELIDMKGDTLAKEAHRSEPNLNYSLAVELVSDYVSSHWTGLLREWYKDELSREQLEQQQKIKVAAESHNICEEKGKKQMPKSAKKKAKKYNTKGMSSIATFFSKKK